LPHISLKHEKRFGKVNMHHDEIPSETSVYNDRKIAAE
jgi:hypothetical protein